MALCVYRLAQFVFGLEVICDLRHSQFLESLPCGIAGIRIPAFNIIEMGLKLIDSFFGEVELPAVLEFPFIAVEYGQMLWNNRNRRRRACNDIP